MSNRNLQYVTIGDLETALKEAAQAARDDAGNATDHADRIAAYAVERFSESLLSSFEYLAR